MSIEQSRQSTHRTIIALPARAPRPPSSVLLAWRGEAASPLPFPTLNYGGKGSTSKSEVKHFEGLLLSIRCRSSVIGRQSPAVVVDRRLWVSCWWSIGWSASSVIDRRLSRVRVVGRLSSSTVGGRSSVVCRSSVIGRWSSVLLRRLSVAGVVSSIVGRLSSAIRRVVVARGRR